MRVKGWPNRLGWDVWRGRNLFEVWCHGVVVRCIPDRQMPCGYSDKEYVKTECRPTGAEGAMMLVRVAQHLEWTPCAG